MYSLLLYALVARTREVGLRMALGARPANASYTVIRDGLRFVVIGAVIGMLICIPMARYAAASFVGADAHDPVPFAAALLAVVFATAAAVAGPARSAARIEPMTALRHE